MTQGYIHNLEQLENTLNEINSYTRKTMAQTTEQDYLRKQGWKEASTLSPYRWYAAKYPGAYYRLKDALIVAQGLAKERGAMKGTRR